MSRWLALLLLQGPFVLTGRVLAFFAPTTQGELPVVLLRATGQPAHLRITRLVRAGDHLVIGNHITAWCHVAGADTVADSVRVEP